MNDRPLGHVIAMLEGATEILEDAVYERSQIEPQYTARIVELIKRIGAAAKEATGKG